MSVLIALNDLYNRMLADEKAPQPGFSTEKISFEMVIAADGRPLDLIDLRNHGNKPPTPRSLDVPDLEEDRTSGIRSNFLWDKTAYLLGVTASEYKDENDKKQIRPEPGPRTAKEHAEFVALHRKRLEGVEDEGLRALLRFLDSWKPDFFAREEFSTDALDKNIVFRLKGDNCFLHERPAALPIIKAVEDEGTALCLVTGEQVPIARVHRSIRGVKGAQSSGASLVSFNEDAYLSYGKKQGNNAPISKKVVFAYKTALKCLLADDSRRKLLVGDTTVVFWAEAAAHEVADFSEMLMGAAFGRPDEATETQKLRENIRKVAEGRGGDILEFDPNTKIHILGLAPNKARLSVRFWDLGNFGEFVRHVRRFWDNLAIEPSPWNGLPTARSLLYETAIHIKGEAKTDTIPPLLDGNLMRSVLTGQPLPRTLLSGVIGRVRADGRAGKIVKGRRTDGRCPKEVDGRRAAICKAVVNRVSMKEKIPMSLDTENMNPAYRLGRFFAVLEYAQKKALETNTKKLNATIKDRYFASAMATPARVFPHLVKNATHHFALLKKGKKAGLGYSLEKKLDLICSGLEVDMPRALNVEDQGRFFVGYYHERYRPKKDDTDDTPVIEENDQ